MRGATSLLEVVVAGIAGQDSCNPASGGGTAHRAQFNTERPKMLMEQRPSTVAVGISERNELRHDSLLIRRPKMLRIDDPTVGNADDLRGLEKCSVLISLNLQVQEVWGSPDSKYKQKKNK